MIDQPSSRGWNEQCPDFRFELPAGWRDMRYRGPDGQQLSMEESENSPFSQRLVAGVVCTTRDTRDPLGTGRLYYHRRLTVQDPHDIPLWTHPAIDRWPNASFDDRMDRWSTEQTTSNGFTITATRSVIVGGADGCLFELRNDAGGMWAEVFIASGDRTYHLTYRTLAPLDTTPLQSMLDSWQWTTGDRPVRTEEPASQLERFRCLVNVELYCPAEVSVRKSGFFAIGSPAVITGVAIGRLMGVQHAKAKARKLAKVQWRRYAQADAVLTDDRVALTLGRGERYELPYSTVKSWRTTRHGLEIERVKFSPVRLRSHDQESLVQQFASLAENHTWRPPVAEELAVEREVVGWCQQDARFTFGVPVGWVPPDAEWMAAMVRAVPGRPVAMVQLLDAGRTIWNVLVAELSRDAYLNPEFVEEAADEVAAQLAGSMRGNVIGPIRILSLGGERAIAMRVSSAPDDPRDVTHIFFTHDGAFFAVLYAVVPSLAGDGGCEAHLPDLHTMLATWKWYQ
jgi:hypothetical protein